MDFVNFIIDKIEYDMPVNMDLKLKTIISTILFDFYKNGYMTDDIEINGLLEEEDQPFKMKFWNNKDKNITLQIGYYDELWISIKKSFPVNSDFINIRNLSELFNYYTWLISPSEPDENNTPEQDFKLHLERASRIVSTWPKWKQNLI